MADDDEDDRQMTREALAEASVVNPVHFVGDGDELLDYLRRRGSYERADAPLPGVILLDLTMPRRGGREVLADLKADPQLRRIPVVVLTTSKAQEDVVSSYELGANSFITKPVTFQGLVDVVRGFARYWLDIVELPGPAGA
jgi:CheY-like chemotaxis protein